MVRSLAVISPLNSGLKEEGFTADEVKQSGFPAALMRQDGFRIQEMAPPVFRPLDLRQAGYTAGDYVFLKLRVRTDFF